MGYIYINTYKFLPVPQRQERQEDSTPPPPRTEVTEVTAAELSRDVEEENGSNSEELASERFVGAAVARM